MKKLLTLILALALILPAAAMADLQDLRDMTFLELVTMKAAINRILWEKPEWKKVEVKAGVWEIGKDIPEGHWTVSAKPGTTTQIFYCERVKPVELRPDHSGQSHTTVIAANDSVFAGDAPEQYSYDMKEGCFFICDDTVIFTPYTGPDFTFE